MEITNKSIQPTVKEALLELDVKVQCLRLLALKKLMLDHRFLKLKKKINHIHSKQKLKMDIFSFGD